MHNNEEYDLKKSTENIGYLYPVILDVNGNIVDGNHRKEADPNWRTEINENLDTPEKVLKAKLIANKFRRKVSSDEVREWINDLAEIAMVEHGVQPGSISGWVAEQTGYAERTVLNYLDQKYKNLSKVEAAIKSRESAAINAAPVGVESELVEELGEDRYYEVEKAIREEAKKDPIFIQEMKKEIEKLEPKKKPELPPDASPRVKPTSIGESVIFSGESCQFIDPELLKPKEGGKDFSHLARFPECICSECEHFQKCRGGKLI